MHIKGRIVQKQNITGTTQKMSNCVKGDVGDYINIVGRIASKQCVLGTLKKSSAICGKIDKPSGHAQSDHQFVIVDLVKLQAQMLAVNVVTAIVPFTAETTQVISTPFVINAVPTAVIVNQETASNVALTATNITVNEEVYTNANA